MVGTMKLLGTMILAFLVGPLLVVAIGFIFAFPWYFAALIAVPLVGIALYVLVGESDRPAAAQPTADQAAIDLLKPEQK